ncbi:MAG: hypothetical protein K2X77_20760 [Candidatus Obscuribacterales bacterium]|jgi:hypothetical protein|nr:hypothetical protein [Candidatus Obscuribacterales bacterium]
MKRRRRALVSVITIFGLLLFAFASLAKQLHPDVLEEIHTASKHYYADSAGPASASAYLAEFKPRFIAMLSACFSNIVSLRPSFLKPMDKEIKSTHIVIDNSRPLWLVNRALLI